MTSTAARQPHLAATPWPAEDGGPTRHQIVTDLPGPRAGSARVAAVRDAAISVMALLGPDDQVLVLRNSIGDGAASWVESVDPASLEVRRRSPDLALGPYWPGGMAVLADGAVVVVQGRHAHRLDPALEPVAARVLPVDAPHNSFVVLSDGTVATKDLQRPDGTASTLSLLDPVTLEDRAAPVTLPEPCVARLSADGDDLYVVGVTGLWRLRWDGAGHVEVPDEPLAHYLVHGHQSFGWDPVVAAGSVWWMDNGDHTFANGFTMLGNGVAEGPVRLWRAPLDGGQPAWREVSGQARGAVTNPPLVDPGRGIVVAFDSANGVLAAFDAGDELGLRWRRPLGAAQHMFLYADTGELVVNDHVAGEGDALAVLDAGSGEVRARTPVPSPAQSVVFGAPGRSRDVYYVSLSTIARVELGD